MVEQAVTGTPSGAAPERLRVATWNVWWRFGDWASRLDAVRVELARWRPDVIGLQEVWATPDLHLAQVLADDLGMSWTWSASPSPGHWQERLGDRSVACGNAVLSRWPILDDARVDLPAGDGDPDGVVDGARTACFALVDTPWGALPFFTTQLSSAPGASALRCAQGAALARFVAGKGLDAALPPVVTGDLNADPASDEVRRLEGALTRPAVAGMVLVDAWRYADPADPGLTWDRRNPHVLATGEPGARIDYVLVGATARHGVTPVEAVRLIGDAPVGGTWPSDHAAVLADLAPRPRPLTGP